MIFEMLERTYSRMSALISSGKKLQDVIVEFVMTGAVQVAVDELPKYFGKR